MIDNEKQTQFVALRAKGYSYARIAKELDVHPNTLIHWARKFHHQVQNQKALEHEALLEASLGETEIRTRALAHSLRQVEEEIARRDLKEVPLARLYALAASLRQQLRAELPPTAFTAPIAEIPPDELPTQTLDWQV